MALYFKINLAITITITRTYACTHARTHARMHARTHTHTHTHTHMHTGTHTLLLLLFIFNVLRPIGNGTMLSKCNCVNEIIYILISKYSKSRNDYCNVILVLNECVLANHLILFGLI